MPRKHYALHSIARKRCDSLVNRESAGVWAVYSLWDWGRLRTSMLPVESLASYSQPPNCNCPGQPHEFVRTLDNVEAVAGLALLVLVGAGAGITLDKNGGAVNPPQSVKVAIAMRRATQSKALRDATEKNVHTPWAGSGESPCGDPPRSW